VNVRINFLLQITVWTIYTYLFCTAKESIGFFFDKNCWKFHNWRKNDEVNDIFLLRFFPALQWKYSLIFYLSHGKYKSSRSNFYHDRIGKKLQQRFFTHVSYSFLMTNKKHERKRMIIWVMNSYFKYLISWMREDGEKSYCILFSIFECFISNFDKIFKYEMTDCLIWLSDQFCCK
jgi:hypothetical protein